jgi:NAD(P)H dehydrogenase (quinone)
MNTIAITGAAGQLGRRILQRLRLQAPAGTRVIGCSRDPGRLLHAPCDEARRADFADPASVERALEGVDRVLLVSIEGDDDQRIRAHAQAAEAARRAGVQRIVYTSFFDVDPASPSIVARVHRESEAAIRATGCEYVLLRDGPYADNMVLRVATAAREGGIFRMPGGDARLPYIGRDDLADAAVAALLGERLESTAWRLAGPELVSFEALCEQVGQAIGTPVHYTPMSDADYLRELAAQGVAPELQQRRLTYVQAMRGGFMTALGDDYLRLVGRPPLTLRELLPRLDLSPGQRLH